MRHEELPKVLVIDDDISVLDCIRLSLRDEQICQLSICDDPIRALQMVKEERFATVITDVLMPKVNGLGILKAVRERDPNIPVIFITGNSDDEILQKAIQIGVFEFIKKPFVFNDLIIRVKRALEAYQLRVQNELYKTNLKNLVLERTVELMDAKSKLEKSYLNTILAMVTAMEVNDVYTRGHSERVTAISIGLGKALGLSFAELADLRIGALLHDLGKIGVISNVLNKAHSLDQEEYDLIKQHPEIGARIVLPIGFPDSISKIILQHHEWYNAEGYPQGLEGEDIHYFARIVSVADSFDAMTSKRKYRENLDYNAASKEIYLGGGKQFDPTIARLFYEKRNTILDVLDSNMALDELLTEAL